VSSQRVVDRFVGSAPTNWTQLRFSRRSDISPSLDDLDLGILRETSRGRVMWWGSSDPRLSIREVARRLKVDPTTVWSRLRAWQRERFLLGYSVVPNPTLFGARLAGGNARLQDSRAKERFFEDLRLIDGAAFAVDLVGEWVVVMLVFQTERQLQRSTALIRRIEGVAEMDPCVPFHCPTTTVTPSRLDWRILKALHEHPELSLTGCARLLGITPKTFARRYGTLIRDTAVWSVPRLDFTRYRGGTLARFIVVLDSAADSQEVLVQIGKRFPAFILLEDQSGLPDLGPERVNLLSLFLQLSSAGEIEDAEHAIRGVKGVVNVESFFLRRIYVYDDWLAERLEDSLRSASRTIPS
jgi:DNA-binding Lrp family transcriptional regulator